MAKASEYTLYSGGLKGSESEFGVQAERWGVKEVNFSSEGHQPDRNRGIVILGPEELKRGDISMEIVSMRMHRSYPNTAAIKKIMQTIFHMVLNGYQVFVVGWIQTDDTVIGGTGWTVELAKLFNRPLSVFDQNKNAWYSWQDNSWVKSQPTIEHKTFVGTGTRFLNEEGKLAIHDLFERSFRP